MIVRTEGDQLLLVRQVDHQFLAGRLAEAWGAAPLARPSDAAIRATFAHDEGWRFWEENPRVDPRTHVPYQFTEVPVAEHLAFYREGVEAAVAKDLYAGLLVNMHCVGLYNGRYGKVDGPAPRQRPPQDQAVITKLTSELEEQQARLREQLQLAADEPSLWRDYTLLQLFDLLSLYLCQGAAWELMLRPIPLVPPGEPSEVKLRPLDSTTVAASPYPFRPDSLQANVAVRMVPNRAYADDREFQDVYSHASEEIHCFDIVPEE
jgi:Protein of unknown function (DUF3891)